MAYKPKTDTEVLADTINEVTTDNGVAVDGVTLKDGNVDATDVTASGTLAAGNLEADTISEATPGNGVIIDGVTLKDNDVSGVDLAATNNLIALNNAVVTNQVQAASVVTTGNMTTGVDHYVNDDLIVGDNASVGGNLTLYGSPLGAGWNALKIRVVVDETNTISTNSTTTYESMANISATINVPSGYYVACFATVNASVSPQGAAYGGFRIYNTTQSAQITQGDAWTYFTNVSTSGHFHHISLQGINTGMSVGNNTYTIQFKRGSIPTTVYVDDGSLTLLAFPYRT